MKAMPYLLLMLALSIFLAAPGLEAQTLTNLYSFSLNPDGNSDGANPQAGLILSGNTLYGEAESGGTNGYGTVFAINTDGTGFTNLHSFSFNDGVSPQGGLVLSGHTLYGVAMGGTLGYGTVFAINTDGSGFTNVYNFNGGIDGADLVAGLIISGNTLYGTASNGGTNNGTGTVFKLNTDGTGFTVLHTFTNAPDGAHPEGGLTLVGNTLYGTTSDGGSLGPEGFNSEGTVFAIDTNGNNYGIVHNFTDLFGSSTSDGEAPYGNLVCSGDTLYGTTRFAGLIAGSRGTVFSVNTNGDDYSVLQSFTNSSDGWTPVAGLTLSGKTLYGTASAGGAFGFGTIFAVNTDGTGFTNLYNFNANPGANPDCGLLLAGNILYGTTPVAGDGSVFALSLVPPLAIAASGNQVVLSWPTWAPNFGLQTTPDLSAGSWSNITSGITVAGSNYTFTNTMSGQAAFFRLQQ